jgi:O-antigen ligase
MPAAEGPGLANQQSRFQAVFLAGALYLTLRCNEYWLFGGAQGEIESGAGSYIYQVLALLTSVLVILAARPWEDLRRVLVLPLSLFLAFSWCWLSIGWSIAPSISMRRVSQLTLTAMVVFTIVDQLGYRRSLLLLRCCFVGALLLSYLVLIIDPEKGIQLGQTNVDPDGVGTWRGVFIDKNMCGAFCAAMISLFVFDAKAIKPLLRLCIVAAATFYLIKTGSKTAMGVQVVALTVGVIFSRYNPAYRAFQIPVAMLAIALALLSWRFMIAPFEQALYDPNAFTGRGPIWGALFLYLRENWILGTGFSAFWGTPNSPAYIYADAAWVRETVRVGHNGYLDIWATVGLPGLILVLLSTSIVPAAKVLTSRQSTKGRAAIIMSLLVLVLGENITESTLFHEKAFPAIILLFTVALAHTIGRKHPEDVRAERFE